MRINYELSDVRQARQPLFSEILRATVKNHGPFAMGIKALPLMRCVTLCSLHASADDGAAYQEQ